MAIPVETRSDASEAEVDQAIVWVARRRKLFAGIVAVVLAGLTAGWTGLAQIETAAEARVLARQATEAQSRAVKANGMAVVALGDRMAKVEDAIGDHADMTRTVIQLLMANPSVERAVDDKLRARAAKVTGSTSD